MPPGAQDRTDLDLTGMTPADLALTASARVLLDEAAYASLVLWGGQVLHGLRFSVIDERLVLLAPARLARAVGDDDLACRVLVCGPVADGRHPATAGRQWVSLALGGWAGAVSASRREDVTLGFVERHVTADLFDLGERWEFLDLDVVELTIRTAESCVGFDADEATAILAR